MLLSCRSVRQTFIRSYPALRGASQRTGRAPLRWASSRAGHSTFNGSLLFQASWRGALALSAAAAAVSGILLAGAKPVHLDAPGPVMPSQVKLISSDELAKHKSRESCWIMVHDKIYDVTEFLDQHPGGARIMLANSGKDATAIYDSLHPAGLLSTLLRPDQCIGVIDPTTLTQEEAVLSDDDIRVEKARNEKPPIEMMVNIDDIEEVAHNVMSKIGWSYYASSADSAHAYKENLESFGRYWFRPRVLRKVRDIDMSTKILGMPSAMPVFVSPAAMAKLGHPLGEINITRGAYKTGIIQGISSNASCTLDEIAGARQGDQNLIFQLYVNSDHAATEKTLKQVEDLGFKAIMFTVDAPCLGKRELDMKARGLPVIKGGMNAGGGARALTAGVATSLGSYFDYDIGWDTLEWIKSRTKLPIILKGVQTVEDVELAAEYGCAGVLLSNHGGRQLDYAPSSIDILYELRQRRPDILDSKKMEIYCDGGFRRGTDVMKALCLGATAVGLGRPFLYGNAAFGEEGVVKVAEIMEEEIATGMRLLGVTRLDQLKPEMVRRFDEKP